jgi:hypothetical protein
LWLISCACASPFGHIILRDAGGVCPFVCFFLFPFVVFFKVSVASDLLGRLMCSTIVLSYLDACLARVSRAWFFPPLGFLKNRIAQPRGVNKAASGVLKRLDVFYKAAGCVERCKAWQ